MLSGSAAGATRCCCLTRLSAIAGQAVAGFTEVQPTPTWPTNLNLVDSLVVGTGKNWKVGEGACKVNLGKFLKVSQWQVLAVSISTADQLRQTLICSAWGAGPICLKGF